MRAHAGSKEWSDAHPGVSWQGAFPDQARLHHKGLLKQVVLQDGGAALLRLAHDTSLSHHDAVIDAHACRCSAHDDAKFGALTWQRSSTAKPQAAGITACYRCQKQSMPPQVIQYRPRVRGEAAGFMRVYRSKWGRPSAVLCDIALSAQ